MDFNRTIPPDQLPVRPTTRSSTLRITVLSATGLRKADWLGKSDPYVIVQILGPDNSIKEEFKTDTVKNTLRPTWNYQQDVLKYSAGDRLSFKVMDEDPWPKPHDFLGKAVLSSENFFPYGYEGALVLSEAGKGVNARLQVKVEILGSEVSGQQESDATQPYGASIPNMAAHFRPPEPRPDKPIASIHSIGSSASPVSRASVGSYSVPGSYGQMPVSYGNFAGSYGQVTSGLAQAPPTDTFQSDELPSSKAAKAQSGSIPSYDSQSIASAHIGPSGTPQYQSQSIGSVGSYPANRSTVDKFGSVLNGSLPANASRDGTSRFQSMEIGSVGSFPASRLVPNSYDSHPKGSSGISQFQSMEIGSVGSFPASGSPAAPYDSYPMGSFQANDSQYSLGSEKNHASPMGSWQVEKTDTSPAGAASVSVQRLTVIVQYARGLREPDYMGKSDPYVKCESQRCIFETAVMENCVEPVWEYAADIDYDVGTPLVFHVMDKDVWPKEDERLGFCELACEEFFPDGFQGEVKLHGLASGIQPVLGLAVFPAESMPQQGGAEIRGTVFSEFDADTHILQGSAGTPMQIRVISARGLLDGTPGCRGECFVAVWDQFNTLLLQTPVVSDVGSPVWNFEGIVNQEGPLSFQVLDQEQLLGTAVVEFVAPPEGMEVDLTLEKGGQTTSGKLRLFLAACPADPTLDAKISAPQTHVRNSAPQVQPQQEWQRSNQSQEFGQRSVSVTIRDAKLNQVSDFVELGRNPSFHVAIETADGAVNFDTPAVLTTATDLLCPVWKYKHVIQNYSGTSIFFTLVSKGDSGGKTQLGQCSLTLDQLYPFGFEGDLTISDAAGKGGILGLLHVQVALAGRSPPQAADEVSAAPAPSKSRMQAATPGSADFVRPAQTLAVAQPISKVVQPEVSRPAVAILPDRSGSIRTATRTVTPEVSYAPAIGVVNYSHSGPSAAQYPAVNFSGLGSRYVPSPAEYVATATVGFDTNADGRPNFLVSGADRNLNGIPDFMEGTRSTNTVLLGTSTYGTPVATIGFDTNLDGKPNFYVSGSDRNLNGIPDYMEGPVSGMRRPRPATVLGTSTAMTTVPAATLGFDTNLDGQPNIILSGPDKNRNGIPDFLEGGIGGSTATVRAPVILGTHSSSGAPSATIGFDTNLNGSPNFLVTGPDRNLNGIPDILEAGVSMAARSSEALRARDVYAAIRGEAGTDALRTAQTSYVLQR